jgi:hypothetical protein
MVILKARSFPKKVCVLHHHGQGSTFELLHKHCPDHHRVLPRVYAYKCSWELWKTWCCGPLCVIPSHHLHSTICKIYNIIVKHDSLNTNTKQNKKKKKKKKKKGKESSNSAENLIPFAWLTCKASKNIHLVIKYVSKDFLLILSREHSIKMSCNVQTHYLHFFGLKEYN